MAKRKSTSDGAKDDKGEVPASKKSKANHDARAGFMDLAGELRNAIYELALEDLLTAPAEDWDLFKTDFTTFRSLLSVSKQVSAEIKGVFDGIAKDMTVYTDNVSRLTITALLSAMAANIACSSFHPGDTANVSFLFLGRQDLRRPRRLPEHLPCPCHRVLQALRVR